MKIKDVNTALEIFKEAAKIHGECTKNGNFKLGNKNHDKIVKAIDYLKAENKMDYLHQFLEDSNISIRLWAAAYLLPFYEEDSLKAFKKVAQEKGIHSFDAETTIQEWENGNLKNYYTR